MPMIEFRYRPQYLQEEDALMLGERLEDALRGVIDKIRPRGKRGYGVTVEGDPFGPIAHSQPDLRIYVFYHQEWHFAQDELERLATGMKENVETILGSSLCREISISVRFYARTGHAGA